MESKGRERGKRALVSRGDWLSTTPVGQISWDLPPRPGGVPLKPSYLFDPQQVVGALRQYPVLGSLLPSPLVEGDRARYLPAARRSSRQLIRLLRSSFEPHVHEFLAAVEHSLERGWRSSTLVGTKGWSEMASAAATAVCAYHFIQCGFQVKNCDETKSRASVPDLLVSGANQTTAIEVFSPRDWPGVEFFMEEVEAAIVNMDAPWDFHCGLRIDLLQRLGREGFLQHLDLNRLSHVLDTPTAREVRISSMLEGIDRRLLTCAGSPFQVPCVWEDLNVRIDIRFPEIGSARTALPARGYRFDGPPRGGYAEDLILKRLVTGRVRRKVAERQALAPLGQDSAVLLVDLNRVQAADGLCSPYYRSVLAEALAEEFKSGACGLDAVVFCNPRPADGLSVVGLWHGAKVSIDEIADVLGPLPGLDRISPGVYLQSVEVAPQSAQ